VRSFNRYRPYYAPEPLGPVTCSPSHAPTRFAFGGYGLVAGLLLLAGYLHEVSTRAAALPLYQICDHWDEAAADVVARLVHEPADASLRQAGDALFRLRRARRNCRAGWFALSCRDYRAIAWLRTDETNQSPMSKSLCEVPIIE
jgi:hypothetical protein